MPGPGGPPHAPRIRPQPPRILPPPPPKTGVALGNDGRFTQPWSGWFKQVHQQVLTYSVNTAAGSVTIWLPPQTPNGKQGSIIITNGAITDHTMPT
jgi:hypothetical protein